MAYIRKAFLKCDRCGAVREVRGTDVSYSSLRDLDEGAFDDGREKVGADRHLCPSCAGPYLSKKREMEAELKRLSGIETVEVDI